MVLCSTLCYIMCTCQNVTKVVDFMVVADTKTV